VDPAAPGTLVLGTAAGFVVIRTDPPALEVPAGPHRPTCSSPSEVRGECMGNHGGMHCFEFLRLRGPPNRFPPLLFDTLREQPRPRPHHHHHHPRGCWWVGSRPAAAVCVEPHGPGVSLTLVALDPREPGAAAAGAPPPPAARCPSTSTEEPL